MQSKESVCLDFESRKPDKELVGVCFPGMGSPNSIGQYQLGQTIGEGTFAKVKLARNTRNGQFVAIKIIDKKMVLENKLIDQVEREIRTMKLLNHPNIVRIYEVLGTKSKIYIVMEYVSGGQLSDKMSYTTRLSEHEARKYFQLLIGAVDYCHCRGVCHRDLKPQNLLLDSKGNLKISDFGISALRKPGSLQSTSCGSPSYVAPELLTSKLYDGAAADVWSCGVILFELIASYLPFQDRSLMNLYRKICRASYSFPIWFTDSQKKLISKILYPNPRTRSTISDIVEDQWFQTDYEPAVGIKLSGTISIDDVHAAFHSRKDNQKQKTKVGSKYEMEKTLEKIEAAAKHVSLSVDRMNNSKVNMLPKQKMARCSRSCFDLSAEVIEVAPSHCVIEISKSAGELGVYKEKSVTHTNQESDVSFGVQELHEGSSNSKEIQELE